MEIKVNKKVFWKPKNILKLRLPQIIAKFIITRISTTFSIDLISLAYSQAGILNYRNEKESGEYHLISTWLKHFLTIQNVTQPCFLDIGANEGNNCKLLNLFHPFSTIYAFEPNPYTYKQLLLLSSKSPQIIPNNLGVAEIIGSMELFIRENNNSSPHASIYGKVLTDVHGYTDVQKVKIQVITLDSFCEQNDIRQIDFLKIDTEGNELNVLRGSTNSLRNGIIKSIQFEFNEMNVYSRVFLRDFYDLLKDFNFYRLLSKSLLPLDYSCKHEIFQFQNILAVRKDLDLVLYDD